MSKRDRNIGVARLHLPNGTVLKRRLVVIRDGRVQGHYPLTDEQPFTTWVGGDLYLEDLIEDSEE